MRYPEAVALKSIDTEVVAEALICIFSRVGLPNEILCDNGSQFVSGLMKEVARLLSITWVCSTPYHPQSNGLCEKWNGSLKRMLKRMCAERTHDWDRYLEPLMFAYREAPQESTRFSPFELLYGRNVRGPMSISRELWTNELVEDEVKNVYRYIFELRNRIEDTCNIAAQNLENAQTRHKKHFDKRTKVRTLIKDDKVLIMLPTDHNKLLMRWKGPYVVTEKVGETDYRIRIGKHMKVFHINMLKRYVQRAPFAVGAAASFVDVNHDEDVAERLDFCSVSETGDQVKFGSDLSSQQIDDLKQLMSRYSEIFSDMPGNTSLVEHTIELGDPRPIRVKPYAFPYAKLEMVKREVEQMLQMNIIEPSKSPFCAPLLLLRKKDNTFRPVIDFRQLNKGTRFDSEPIPNPDVTFAKLAGKQYFSKLDFCKGYWQIPMSPDDREKTAFASPHGLFQFRRMPFGLVNSGATYTRMMKILLAGLADVDNYIDDILVHSET